MINNYADASELSEFRARLSIASQEDTSPAVIFDMDGTLVDVTELRHAWLLRDEQRKDFNAFHRESVNAPPIPWVKQAALEVTQHNVAVLIVSARSVRWRPQTAWWLAMHEIHSDALYLRAEGDNRSDAVVKADMLERICTKWKPIWAFDDNPRTILVWEQHGIPVTVVPGWETD